MHAKGEPKTMHLDPRYDDVVLEVYDYLEGRIAAAEAVGIERARIAADPASASARPWTILWRFSPISACCMG